MAENLTNSIWKRPLAIMIVISLVAFGAMVFLMVIPKTKVVTSGDLRVEYTPDKDDYEFRSHLFPVKVQTPHGVASVVLHYGGKEGFQKKELEVMPGDSTWYVTSLVLPEKGIRTYYYFVVRDVVGNEVILPSRAKSMYTKEYHYFKLRSEGHVWQWALYLHVLLMLIAFVLYVHVLYDALYILHGGHRERRIVLTTLYAQVCFFISGFPLGWIIEKQVLGNYWEGIPFGWDITDSKTLFIFVFWMIPLILYWTKRIGEKGFAWWALGAVLFTIAMFALPHSI
jgi:hypothetical protein